MARATKSSIDESEIAQFSGLAEQWWNPQGPLAPLHRLNPCRIAYVRDQIVAHGLGGKHPRQILQGLDVLDVGCGGGLLAEPLARLGARVTGLDASAAAIATAERHAKKFGLNIDYRTGSVEDLARGSKRYDVVTAMEIVEHVADLDMFVAALAKLVRPGGLLVMSTLNRTPESFLLGIIAAEYVLCWVPRGTHHWKKFVRPSELVSRLEIHGMATTDLTGMVPNLRQGGFALSKNRLSTNYLLTAVQAKVKR